MPHGWRDFTVPIAVEAVTVESLPIDVKAQSLGTLKVDVAAQSLAELNVNLAASTVTLDVNIVASAVSFNVKTDVGEHVDSDIVSSITLPIDITAQTISTLAVDITAQTLGQLNVNIASSAATLNVAIQSSSVTLNIKTDVGEHVDTDIVSSVTLPINITAQTISTLAVDIKAQTLEQLNVNIAAAAVSINVKTASGEHVDSDIVSSVTLPINITAQTISTLAVDIKAQSLGQLNVNLAASAVTLNVAIQSSAVTLPVNIAAQAVDINVKTSSGANIVIDKLTQSAIDARYQRLIRVNDPPPDLIDWPWTDFYFHQHYPRGARGFIEKVRCYLKNVDSANAQSIVLAFSPFPGYGEVFTVPVTVPAGGSWGWYEATVRKMWNYDSCFVWTKTGNSQIYFGIQADRYGGFRWTGSEWIPQTWAAAIALDVYSLTAGDLPVSGTVNTVEVPSVGSILNSGTKRVNGEQTVTLVSVTGAGRVEGLLHNVWVAGGTPSAYNDNMQFVIDGELTQINLDYLARTFNFRRDTVSPFSLIEYDVGAKEWGVALNKPIYFKRSFEFRIYNNAVAGNDFHARAIALITLLR